MLGNLNEISQKMVKLWTMKLIMILMPKSVLQWKDERSPRSLTNWKVVQFQQPIHLFTDGTVEQETGGGDWRWAGRGWLFFLEPPSVSHASCSSDGSTCRFFGTCVLELDDCDVMYPCDSSLPIPWRQCFLKSSPNQSCFLSLLQFNEV